MAEPESHSVRNGVLATVVGGIALGALGELWPPLKSAGQWLWAKGAAVVGLFGATYATPGWVLATAGLLALITVVRLLVGLRSSGPVGPSHLQYVEDELFGAKWRWSWFRNEIASLWCFCPRCDSELVYDDHDPQSYYSREPQVTRFVCEHCNNLEVARMPGRKTYALEAVQREIRRRIRTGQFKGAAVEG